MDVTLEHDEESIRFFKVYAGLNLPNLSQKVLVCTISHELISRFQPDLHGHNTGTWWRADWVLMTLAYFSRSLQYLNFQIWLIRCLCAQYLMNQLADFNQICMGITFWHDKKLNRFWWPSSNFKVTARLYPPKLSQKVFVCMLSHGPLVGMLPNLQAYINRTGSINY